MENTGFGNFRFTIFPHSYIICCLSLSVSLLDANILLGVIPTACPDFGLNVVRVI